MGLSLLITCFTLYFTQDFLEYILYAKNSLLGVRSTFPLLIGIFIIAMLGKYHEKWNRLCWAAYCLSICLLLSLAFFCGTEQGMASIAAYSIFHFFYVKKLKNIKKAFVESLGILFISSLGIVALFLVVSGKNFLDPIRYHLIEVPKDQFWYFGVPPNGFLYSFSQIMENFDILRASYYFTVLYGILLLCFTLFYHKKNNSSISWGIFFLILYGFLSTFSILGIYMESYCQIFLKLEIFITLVYLFTFNPVSLVEKLSSSAKKIFLGGYCFALGVLFFFLSYNIYIPNLLQTLENLTKVKHFHEKKILGVYFNEPWYKYIQAIQEHISIPLSFCSIPFDEEEYINGISTTKASLFVEYSKIAADSVQEGMKASFKKSGQRKIQKVEIAWKVIHGIRQKYIKLDLEGDLLSPGKDGYPNKIFLLEKDVPGAARRWPPSVPDALPPRAV